MTAKKITKLDTRKIGDAGEYYVAFRLAKMGISSAMLSKGSKSVDILATVDGSKSVSIQVKTTPDEKGCKRWYAGSKPEPSETLYFIFVNIYRPGTSEFSICLPEVYVVPSRVVEKTVDWEDPRPRFHLTAGTSELYRERWDHIKEYLGVD